MIVRDSDGAVIPQVSGNADYQAYQAWVAEGNIPSPVPAPTAEQALASTVVAAIAEGLTINSASTPSINGIYPLDSNTTQEIASVMLFVQVNGVFPGNASTYPWFDTSNIAHVFPSIAVFKEWATAIANYIAALKLYGAGVAGAVMPDSTVAIA